MYAKHVSNAERLASAWGWKFISETINTACTSPSWHVLWRLSSTGPMRCSTQDTSPTPVWSGYSVPNLAGVFLSKPSSYSLTSRKSLIQVDKLRTHNEAFPHIAILRVNTPTPVKEKCFQVSCLCSSSNSSEQPD
jgi:hypothetical protein